ncbi:MAG: AmmeMemoRadiSam system protein A [Pseudomonadota bacterium]
MTTTSLTQEQQKILLNLAKQSILYGLENQQATSIAATDYPIELQQQRASFVSLNINQQLRGCIGCLSAYRSLVEDVSANAYAAAFSDSRFPAVNKDEFPFLEYHISILSPSSPIQFIDEDDLLSQIHPGRDGLILSEANNRATFLPSVWEQLRDKQQFLNHLKQKAGLSANYWSNQIQVSRYSVENISN